MGPRIFGIGNSPTKYFLTGNTGTAAIGAEVKLTAAQGSQFSTVTTTGSYLSSSDERVHFGLGLETTAPSIEIRWPSGLLQRLSNVRADQVLQIDEPAAGAFPK